MHSLLNNNWSPLKLSTTLVQFSPYKPPVTFMRKPSYQRISTFNIFKV